MAEPLGRRLRTARHSRLTSPDPVRTRTPQGTPAPQNPAQEPVDRPQNRQRQHKHAPKRVAEAGDP